VWATSTGATVDADAHGSVKIRAIRVIRVPRRDGGIFSYMGAGIEELCALCGEISSDNIAEITFINVP